jgi:pyruvate dehydrogenase E1 component beta subunit
MIDPTLEAEYDIETVTMREAISQALEEEMQRKDDVFIMGEDIGIYGGVYDVTNGFLDKFGSSRVRDTPISEAGIVGTGVGAAMAGARPVVELMFGDFIGVCGEQIINQMAKTRYKLGGQATVPLTIRAPEGAGRRAGPQHSGTLHTWIAHFPGLKAVAPGTPAAAKGLLKTAIRSDDPVFFFENKITYSMEGPVPVDEDFTLPLGDAGVVQSGSDVTVVATQRLLWESVEAAEALAGDISVEVIDPRSLYPLDTETIAGSLGKTGRLIIADESPLSYGTHAEIGMRMQEEAFYQLDAPIQRVGVEDVHIPFSPGLEDEVMPMADDVRAAIESII